MLLISLTFFENFLILCVFVLLKENKNIISIINKTLEILEI
jgi:hypothetical protein